MSHTAFDSATDTSDLKFRLLEDTTANFPCELRDRDQWVCWRLEDRNNRPTKVPYSPVTGRHALTTVASTWGSFDQAAAVVEPSKGTLGLGYVFSEEDPYCGIDFDHCIELGSDEIAPWARDWIDRLKSYTELSPSGTGLHVFVRGQLPGKGRKRNGIEAYDRGRFFTVTGQPIAHSPSTVEKPEAELNQLYESLAPKADATLKMKLALRQATGPELPDETVIDVILASPRRIAFQKLWNGNWKARYGSQSEADLSLTGILAEYVGNNPVQIDRLFRQSGLYRDKWDEHRGELTYGEKTIAITLQQDEKA